MKRLFLFLTMLLMGATVLTAQDTSPKYGIKSGSYTLISEVMGQKVESKGFFDEYGNLQASKTNTFGMEITTVTRDGKTYMVNHAAKQVQELPAQESINYLDLTDAIIAKYKIREAGSETVAGKDCVKYTLTVSQMGQTADLTVSIWCGIPMKTVTSANGMEVTATITQLEEGDIDSSVFEVPSFD